MRLIVYNIRYGAGIGKRFHLPVPYSGYLKPTNGHFGKIVDFIKSVNPDIVGLIEVDFGSYRVERFNQAETIARELNHQVVCKSKYAEASMARKVPVLNKQGNAILTGLPIVASRYHFFNEGVKRLVIEVELQEVIVFLVHLSLKFRHRQYQLNDLHALIAGCDKPVIVAGDFNVLWGDRELQLFLAASGLTSANVRSQFSYPSRNPHKELDYIFHSPEIRSTGFQVPKIKLSDHAPLVWDFEIDDPKTDGLVLGNSAVVARPPGPSVPLTASVL
jgi:endonuclease/exonuclease/phosphatase family metal-dependent hydrolase